MGCCENNVASWPNSTAEEGTDRCNVTSEIHIARTLKITMALFTVTVLWGDTVRLQIAIGLQRFCM